MKRPSNEGERVKDPSKTIIRRTVTGLEMIQSVKSDDWEFLSCSESCHSAGYKLAIFV